MKKPVSCPSRCGIVVRYSDEHSWNLATFYEMMVKLHSPESVIVFGDEGRPVPGWGSPSELRPATAVIH